MIAAVGGTRKVIGSRIATPLTEPRPGIAPISRPIEQPRKIIIRLTGCIASSSPAPSNTSTVSIGALPGQEYIRS